MDPEPTFERSARGISFSGLAKVVNVMHIVALYAAGIGRPYFFAIC